MTTDGALLDGYLTVEATAAELGVHPFTLKRWKANDYGPKPVRVGKRLYYRRADMAAWLESLGKPEPGRRGSR